MKKTLMVSNSWRPAETEAVCGKCGSKIEYKWGEYSFRYSEKKDKSDLCLLCKNCAVELKNNDKQVKVISRSPLMELINLKNSGWKPQPEKGPRTWKGGASVGGRGSAGEINSGEKKDTDK